MTEIEILKAQVAALEKLVAIKDQTIAQLQAHPQRWGYQPVYPQWVTSTSAPTLASTSGYEAHSAAYQNNQNTLFKE